MVVRGHLGDPGDIPGFSVEIWILGYNECSVLVAGKFCTQQSILCFVFDFPFFSVIIHISYFASTRVADLLEWYS